jgi:rRNA maturation protein Nop10
VSRARSVYWDPDGTRYGIPTYPWRCAPSGLATRRQLAANGLRPGGQPIAAQVMWHSSRRPSRHDVAYLYRVDLAKPKRVPTAAQLAALGKAMAARRTCPKCGGDAGYVLPRHWAMCAVCAAGESRRCPECGRDAGYALRPGHDVCRACAAAGADEFWTGAEGGMCTPMHVTTTDYDEPGRWWL